MFGLIPECFHDAIQVFIMKWWKLFSSFKPSTITHGINHSLINYNKLFLMMKNECLFRCLYSRAYHQLLLVFSDARHAVCLSLGYASRFSYCELFSPFLWSSTCCCCHDLFHISPSLSCLQISLVNLNNMVCPAVSDPFHGRWYRVCAVIHQTAAILVLGKVYTLLCKLLIPAQSANTVQEDSVTKNGHCKTP